MEEQGLDQESIIEQLLQGVDTGEAEALTGLEGADLLPGTGLGDILRSLLSGETPLSVEAVWEVVKTLLFGELWSAVALGSQVLLICVVIGLLQSLSGGFGSGAVASVGSMVCSCVIIALCLHQFSEVYRLCGRTVGLMATVMLVLLPIMVPFLFSMGSIAAGSILNPAILASITVFSAVIKRVILPLFFFSCILFLADSLSEKNYVNKLASFLRSLGIFAMGLAVTVFSGITAIQGLFTQSADGLLVKTARYSIDNFIPLVGGFAADSLEMVLRCTALIKNGIGIFGLVLLLSLLLTPLVKIAVVALVYKLTAVLTEPIGNKPVSDCLNEVGNTVVLLGAVLLLATILFLVFLAILINIKVG